MAGRPPQVFATVAEAADRHLELAGLRELVDPADPVALAGVRRAGGGWVAGSTDPMVGLDAMRRVDPDAVLVDGAGRSAHWENPAAVLSLLT